MLLAMSEAAARGRRLSAEDAIAIAFAADDAAAREGLTGPTRGGWRATAIGPRPDALDAMLRPAPGGAPGDPLPAADAAAVGRALDAWLGRCAAPSLTARLHPAYLEARRGRAAGDGTPPRIRLGRL